MVKKKSFKKISTKTLSNKIEKALLFLTNPRVREIIERRFGLKDGKLETLESIGKSYNITRERVRQIQDSGLKILRSDQAIGLFIPIFKELDKLFFDHGHIMGEEYLYSIATGTDGVHSLRGQLYLVLTLGEPYQRVINDDIFYTHWTADKVARNKAKKVVDYLDSYFKKNKKVFKEDEILSLLKKAHSALPSGLFNSVLDIAKGISKNNFGEVGLINWAEISPQGVKDRAYLVLKKEEEPKHFVDITDLINKVFDDRRAHVQTVHNELIKDPRFILTGRGRYALSEWGYEPGTVEQVIQRVLKKGPMTKKQIIDSVLTQRQVKPTTIVLNLQRSPKTQQLGDGRFALV